VPLAELKRPELPDHPAASGLSGGIMVAIARYPGLEIAAAFGCGSRRVRELIEGHGLGKIGNMAKEGGVFILTRTRAIVPKLEQYPQI
jgi:hypothetical protein